MEQFIRSNFEIKTITKDGQLIEIFKSRDNPESWTELQAFLNVFGAVNPVYDDLTANVGKSGFQPMFDEWKERGLI